MSDVFLSCSRSDQERVARVAEGLESAGRSVWWDRRSAAGGDHALEIERQIDAAQCVIVAWSPAAQRSLWVRAEANEALDTGKLVQIAYGAPRLPLPFAMFHYLDFTSWNGSTQALPWPRLAQEVANRLDEVGDSEARSGVTLRMSGPEPALQGLGGLAVIGWTALGIAVLVALATLLVSAGLIRASVYNVLSLGALAAASGLFAACAFLVFKVARASRR